MLIDIDYYKNYVYIHKTYFIKMPMGKTVSVEVTILRKNGFRSYEDLGLI